MLSMHADGNGSPLADNAAAPAICLSHTKGALSASRTLSVASVISGPMPSPEIKVAGTGVAGVLLIAGQRSTVVGRWDVISTIVVIRLVSFKTYATSHSALGRRIIYTRTRRFIDWTKAEYSIAARGTKRGYLKL